MPNLGINGFGHAGRMTFRAALACGQNVVAINEPNMTIKQMAYSLTFDSSHGKFIGGVGISEHVHAKTSAFPTSRYRITINAMTSELLIINGVGISIYHARNPKDIPWNASRVDYVLETTDSVNSMEMAEGHLTSLGKAKVILISYCPGVPILMPGVNLDTYGSHMKVMCTGGPTVYCLALLTKVMQENFGIEEGVVTSIESVSTVASNNLDEHGQSRDMRRSRGVMNNIIPTRTNDAKILGIVFPCLRGKIKSMAISVPTTNEGVVDFTCKLCKSTTYSSVLDCMRKASATMQGLMDMADHTTVSRDIKENVSSCVFDPKTSSVLNEDVVTLVAWYNDMASGLRLVDLISYIHTADHYARCLQQTQLVLSDSTLDKGRTSLKDVKKGKKKMGCFPLRLLF